MSSSQHARTAGQSSRATTLARSAVIMLVVLQAVLVGIVAASLLLRSDRSARLLGIDRDLRGSLPPEAAMPAFHTLDGIAPPLDLRTHDGPALVVATCTGCRSGDVWGRVLGDLDTDRVGGASLHAVTWGAGTTAWRRTWQLPRAVHSHRANVAGASEVRAMLHVGDSGVAFLYGSDGRWRATYHLGQADADDIAHDLRLL